MNSFSQNVFDTKWFDTISNYSMVDGDRQIDIFNHLKRTQILGEQLNGACVEVGVYKGGVAELIALNKGERDLYLFDTFEGIPFSNEKDNYYKQGYLDETSLEEVVERLKKYPKVHIHKGIFPDDTGHFIDNLKFSFVHLDVDVYRSYKDCLSFFYPRMLKGGVIICDDYGFSHELGAKTACDEFFEHKQIKDDLEIIHKHLVVTIG